MTNHQLRAVPGATSEGAAAARPGPLPLSADDPRAMGGYRFRARLGSGGMGTVYLSHTADGRLVAVKVIRPEIAQAPEFRRRFAQEVEAARRVQGPNTAPVIDSDTDGPIPWLATAYVPGPSLQAAVAEHGALPVPSVLPLVAGIAEALRTIHHAGVVHRDLKPSNVLLAVDGPRVTDFGIAHPSTPTGSGAVVGTPAFLAPEQAAGTACTPATDVFAVGQIAAFASMGAAPFGDGPSNTLLYRIVHEEPDLSELPGELREIVTRCLIKDPALRPSTAQIIAMCGQAAQDCSPRRSGEWLPAAVSAGLAAWAAAAAPLPPLPSLPPLAAGAHPGPPPRPDQPPPPAGPPRAIQPPATTAPGAPPLPAGSPEAMRPPPTSAPGTPPPPAGHLQPPGPPPAVAGLQSAGRPCGCPAAPAPRPRPGRVVAAVVAAAAVLAVAVAFGVHLAGGRGAVGGSAGRAPAGHDTGAPSYGGLAQQPGGTASAPPAPVTYTLDLPGEYYVSLRDDPPHPIRSGNGAAPGEGEDLRFVREASADLAISSHDGGLVLLDGSQRGSLDLCRHETRYTGSVPLRSLSEGSQLCVTTEDGSIALATVRGLPAPESATDPYVALDLTVWRS